MNTTNPTCTRRDALRLGAGVAGAISLASGISVAIVGVMIAAALVPPIAVVGIGIAWGMPMTVLSSSVLVLVNVLSINLAALAVFWYKGYRPDNWFQHDAARSATVKRIGTLVVVIALLSVFLAGVTYSSYENAQYRNDVRSQVDAVVGHGEYARYELVDVEVAYDTSVPFRRPQRVVATVGRPDGAESPHLAGTLRRRIARQTKPAFGIGSRLTSLVFLPAIGLSQATETVVGQNLGSGRSDRSRQGVFYGIGMLAVGLAVVSAVFYAFAEPIVGVFITGGESAAVVAVGVEYVRVIAPTFVFMGAFNVVNGGFRGAGSTETAMAFSILSLWLFRIPPAYALVSFAGWGPEAVWYAIAFSNVVTFVVAGAWFLRGTWAENVVEPGDPSMAATDD
ncbi:MATE family efflux transporter [Halobium palmae]|uniref:MATE family efflux transporter n=1 Tax=Halobium palmae TaxID=1776492 RepID=A0ABD5RYZ5_9EURY